MKCILVTGGAGFIGSNFVRHVLGQRPDITVVNLDVLTYAASLENLNDLPDPDRHHFIRGDICDRELVERTLRDYTIDVIVHFAAESHVDRSIAGPAPFVQTNVVGTFTLLEAAREVWGDGGGTEGSEKRFLHISSDEVFGSLGPDDPPFSETTHYAPSSPYAASKAASDHLVRAYHHTYGLPVLITNCSNNYGPYQFPEKLIPLMILNALAGEPLPVYGDGRQVRDWLYVEDHCEALLSVLERGRAGETYIVGGGVQPTNLEVVTEVCAILDEIRPGSGAPYARLIRFVADRPGHDLRYAMDTSKIRSELGWEPSRGMGDGLRSVVAWYLEHNSWVEAIRGREDFKAWIGVNYANRGLSRP